MDHAKQLVEVQRRIVRRAEAGAGREGNVLPCNVDKVGNLTWGKEQENEPSVERERVSPRRCSTERL